MAGSCPTRNLAIHISHVCVQTNYKKITFLARKIDFLRHVIKMLSQSKSIAGSFRYEPDCLIALHLVLLHLNNCYLDFVNVCLEVDLIVTVLKCLRLSSDPVTLRLRKGEFNILAEIYLSILVDMCYLNYDIRDGNISCQLQVIKFVYPEWFGRVCEVSRYK